MREHDLNIIAPASTYRIQLNKDFTFRDLEQIVDYLDELGIGGLYVSPILKATPGSTHGYDGIDPLVINPELGDLDDLKSLSKKLKSKGMLWIQDIVPNHMAFNSHNTRLMDVLERGRFSGYADFFDIDWHHKSPLFNGKLMVPFLGKTLESCLEHRELILDSDENGIFIKYADQKYPLSISAYQFILNEAEGLSTPERLTDLRDRVQGIQARLDQEEWGAVKSYWLNELRSDEDKKRLLDDVLLMINQDPLKLKFLLDLQFYALTHWRRTEREINYRRFFTVNELICLRMERKEVFDEYHALLFELHELGIIDGLRVDHIDGLNDPETYLSRLRKLFGPKCYIVIEKILEHKETIPENWPVQGESGYEFLAAINQLLTNRQGAKELVNFYNAIVPELPAYEQLVINNKSLILSEYMGGEWENLTNQLIELGLHQDFPIHRIKQALKAIMVFLPVYRIYLGDKRLSDSALSILEETCEEAIESYGEYRAEILHLKKLFLTSDSRILTFLKRLMQYTGPTMAKGVEDTTFYEYDAMISHCEVGDSPSIAGISSQDFHERMIERCENLPLSMNTTSTHDTKRGEDARIRLNVISEFPALWEKNVREWIQLNKKSKYHFFPDTNDEYFIYQTLVGSVPETLEISTDYKGRLANYLIKAFREAKVNTNWKEPNVEYEESCLTFVEKILGNKVYTQSLKNFVSKILQYGRVYSQVQVLVKATAPGIPDTYQGSELWDLSFVDPDNRRPVDFDDRKQLLNELKNRSGSGRLIEFIKENESKALGKMFIHWKVLNYRKEHKHLFFYGKYQPLLSTRKGVVLAYLRKHEDNLIMVVVPIGLSLYWDGHKSEETEVILNEECSGKWKSILTDEELVLEGKVDVDQLFSTLPVCFLKKMSN